MSHVKLGDLYRIGSSKRVLQSQWTTEGVPFYRGREITKLSECGFVENDLFITEELFNELSQRSGVPQAGDIMITAIGTIGNSYIVCPDDRFYFKDASVLWLARNSDVSSEYINHWLKSPLFLDQLDRGNGATVDTLTIQKLQGVLVHVPSASEQRRIVTLLDEAFADIATAKANAEKNLQNARDLLESHLQAAFTQQADWELKAFGELAEFRNGINFNKSSKGNEIKIVGVRDFQKNFWAPLDDLETIIPDGEIPATDLIESGDLLFVRSNGNPELIGRTLLIGDLNERITHSGFTIKARLHHTELSPIYLCHYLKSGLLRREMIEGGNGANIKSLNQGTLSRLKIAFPDKSKQLLIVEHLETVQAEIAELESIYRQKLTALDDLKKSLLHQAFSGQL